MYGAIIGDVVGSTYEFAGRKTKNFPLFPGGINFTDDSIMTIAVAKALMRSEGTGEPFDEILVKEMRTFGEEYPHPKGGYGVRFREWLDPVLEFDKLGRQREEVFAHQSRARLIRME